MNAISNANGLFPVKKLAEFKGIETPENMFLVRKIEKGTGKDSLGCFVPAVTQEGFVSALENTSVFNAAIEWYQGAWNDFLKEKLTEGNTLIQDDLEISGFVAWLDAEEVKQGRISKEKIGAWFDSQVASVLTRAFHEKLGAIENDKMLEILKSYRGQFMNLAKRELTLSEPVRVNLNKAISLLGDSPMKDYCEKKLQDAAKLGEDLLAL